MMVYHGSLEYIPAELTKVADTVASDAVRFCLSTSRREPKLTDPEGEFDGTDAMVETDDDGVQTALCLHDPEDGLAVGEYVLWLEITTASEVVVFPVAESVEVY